MSEYIMNKETGKIELHFEKSDYMSLAEGLKRDIKSNFLFSRVAGAWVSRAKFPNLWRAKAVAEKIGLADGGKVGEMLSFEEQQQVKAEKAEHRAERYEVKSANAMTRGTQLQKPIDDMHGDIFFFTQPNINSSSGRAFTNRRNKMFASFERGFEEFKKSEYYAERAEATRTTAGQTRPTDKGFIDRRIKDTEKTIKAQKGNLESYNNTLEKIDNGKVIKRYSGAVITHEDVQGWIENAEDIIEQAISKYIYYKDCMDALGGVQFSKENIETGYIVELKRWGKCKVIGTGPINIKYQIMEGGAAGCGGTATYAEIEKVISNEKHIEKHPFVKGEKFMVKEWDKHKYVDVEYIVTKITDEKVTIKCGNKRARTLKPRKFGKPGDVSWALGIADGLNGIIYKKSQEV